MEFLEECVNLLAEGWSAIFKVVFLVVSVVSGLIGIMFLLASFCVLFETGFGTFVVGIIIAAFFLAIGFFGFVMYKVLCD